MAISDMSIPSPFHQFLQGCCPHNPNCLLCATERQQAQQSKTSPGGDASPSRDRLVASDTIPQDWKEAVTKILKKHGYLHGYKWQATLESALKEIGEVFALELEKAAEELDI